MTLGDPTRPALAPGDSFEGTPTFTFDDVMSKLGGFLKEDPVTKGEATDNLRVTLANFRKVSQSLADSLGEQRAELTEIVRNVGTCRPTRNRWRPIFGKSRAREKKTSKSMLAKFRSISERLDQITERVQNGEGLLGRLVNDPELGKNLDQTMVQREQGHQRYQRFHGPDCRHQRVLGLPSTI
jgi:hypothetical protein